MQLIRFIILIALCSIAATIVRAEEPKKPAQTKLSELDLTKLKLAIATRELAQQQAQHAVEQANEAETEIDRICKDYKIDRARLDRSVNAKTGEITREPEPKKSTTKK